MTGSLQLSLPPPSPPSSRRWARAAARRTSAAWSSGTTTPSGRAAIIDADTHEQLARLFSDPARRKHVVGRKYHLLSGLAPCPRCGHGLKYRMFPAHRNRADSYACVRGPGGRSGGVAINAVADRNRGRGRGTQR
jgi:hypothetical protein